MNDIQPFIPSRISVFAGSKNNERAHQDRGKIGEQRGV
jgi:hypothetical protein